MTYCTDTDLVKYRPNILSLGVDSWEEQRDDAYDLINRVIRARWYMDAAVENGYDPRVTIFDPDLVEDGFLERLECFKTLELAYMHLAKDSPEEDGFERNMSSFRDRYNEELDLIFSTGVNYDWSGDDEITGTELYMTSPRRNARS